MYIDEPVWVQSNDRLWACKLCCVLICSIIANDCCLLHSENKILSWEWLQNCMVAER